MRAWDLTVHCLLNPEITFKLLSIKYFLGAVFFFGFRYLVYLVTKLVRLGLSCQKEQSIYLDLYKMEPIFLVYGFPVSPFIL